MSKFLEWYYQLFNDRFSANNLTLFRGAWDMIFSPDYDFTLANIYYEDNVVKLDYWCFGGIDYMTFPDMPAFENWLDVQLERMK